MSSPSTKIDVNVQGRDMSHAEFDVFLSHNSADKPEVLKLATKLKDLGFKPWVDAWHLVAGEPWLPAIERALANSESCVIIVGPNGLGNVHEDEMWAALQHGIESKRGDRRYRIIPVLLPHSTRGRREKLPTFLTANTWVEFPRSIDDTVALDKLAKAIRGQAPGAGIKLVVGECPYRGLAYFDIQHTNLFFGREGLTDWLLSRLRGTATKSGPTRFLAIMGASGSGKSSLARAGVLAKLKANELRGSASWPLVICRPESRPLENLATALGNTNEINLGTGLKADLIAQLAKRMLNSPDTLHLIAQAAMPANDPDWRLVVFVDQFEELFTLNVPDPNDARSAAPRSVLGADHVAFVRNLLYASAIQNGRTIVILTMRADFYGKCAALPELADAVSGNQQLVGPMNADELRRSIETPAQLCGGDIESGLVDLLVSEVANHPGALPLLQYALAELWKKSSELGSGKLTMSAYRELGGWEGALSQRADAVLAEFKNTPQEKLCRELFLRLVQLGDGTEDTKRLVRWEELKRVNKSEAAALEQTVRKLADNRLITTGGEIQPGETLDGNATVEVVHEALIRGWKVLRNWLESNRAGLRTHRQLTDAANEWAKSDSDVRKRDPSLLYTGTRLATSLELAKRSGVTLNEVESRYLEASTQAIRSRKQRAVLSWVGTAAAVVLIVIVGTLIAVNYQNDARVREMVESLKNAKESEVSEIVKGFKGYRRWANQPLQHMFTVDSAESAKLHAALALAPVEPVDGKVIGHLRKQLLTATPAQFPLIRDSLRDYDPEHTQQIEEHWQFTQATTNPISERFQAACALAKYAPEDARWSAIAPTIANHLTTLPIAEAVAWRTELLSARKQLQQPLATIFRTSPKESQIHQFAAETLTEYASDNGELLGELLLEADTYTFELFFTAGENPPVHLEARLQQELDSMPSDDVLLNLNDPLIMEGARDALARKQSHAIVGLARLGQFDVLWPRLAFKPDPLKPLTLDPRLRTELIHDLFDYGIDKSTLIGRLESEQDVSTRRALLLALAKYPPEPPQEDQSSALIAKLLAYYENESDAGLHGAIEWLLRKWNFGKNVQSIVSRLTPTNKAPRGHRAIGDRKWYLNGQGQTFTIFPKGEFTMGTPEFEPDRQDDELQHQRLIERDFAIATTEVTRSQYLEFSQATSARDPDNLYVKSTDSPQTGVEWFEAARYCNWLSEHEGIDKDQWCFDPNEKGEYGPGMKTKEGFLDLAGYRLPTEAEWEYACRAGSATSRHYGISEDRLGEYAWYLNNGKIRTYPVGQKKPNDAGLFDMLGNAHEWCHDAGNRHPEGQGPFRTLTDQSADMDATRSRVLRGGAILYPASFVRSGYRNNYRPEDHTPFFGFRVARTYQ